MRPVQGFNTVVVLVRTTDVLILIRRETPASLKDINGE